jgi:hypothetical protein
MLAQAAEEPEAAPEEELASKLHPHPPSPRAARLARRLHTVAMKPPTFE